MTAVTDTLETFATEIPPAPGVDSNMANQTEPCKEKHPNLEVGRRRKTSRDTLLTVTKLEEAKGILNGAIKTPEVRWGTPAAPEVSDLPFTKPEKRTGKEPERRQLHGLWRDLAERKKELSRKSGRKITKYRAAYRTSPQ